MVSACKGVVEHRGKLWRELTEGESNIVATRIGVIAREVLGPGRARRDRRDVALTLCGAPQQCALVTTSTQRSSGENDFAIPGVLVGPA